MAKRKTRQHKIALEQRRSMSKDNIFSYSLKEAKISSPKASNRKTEEYPFLIHDLSKTAILTALIVVAQFSLYYLLKTRVLTLPGLSY